MKNKSTPANNGLSMKETPLHVTVVKLGLI